MDGQILRCLECGALSAHGHNWKAEISDDPRDDDPAEVAVFCPACWRREFGDQPTRGYTTDLL